jgi:hypothetical protein
LTGQLLSLDAEDCVAGMELLVLVVEAFDRIMVYPVSTLVNSAKSS